MIENKKDRERKLLEEFLTNYLEFPEGKVEDSERPDFLIRQREKIIGIEIVDFIRGQDQGESADRRNEILWQNIADEARKRFEAKSDIPLQVYFFWNNHYILRKLEISQLADSVISLIEKSIPEKLSKNIRFDFNEIDDALLKKVCRSINILRVGDEKQSQWSFGGSGWIEVQTNEIQYILDSKNEKVTDYLRNCDTVWLIIVADGRYISSNIAITSEAMSHIYKTSFEKVFVYDRFSKGVFPLRLQ